MLQLFTRFISYPRTETNMFPKSLDLRPLVENQTVDPNWGGKANYQKNNIVIIIIIIIVGCLLCFEFFSW